MTPEEAVDLAATAAPEEATSHRRWLVLALAGVVLSTGCGEEEDVSPNFEDRIPPGFEFKVADRVIELGESTNFAGTLTQGKEKLAGVTVVLEADPYPFSDSYAKLESVETDDAGGFEFEASPDANTAYRVAAGEVSQTTSDERFVYVEPRTKLEAEPAGNGTRFTTVFNHPEDRSILGSSVFSYASTAADAEAAGELPFIQVNPVSQEKPGLSKASIVLPFAEDEIRYETCFGYTPDSGLGAPNQSCSQTSIKAK